MDFVRRGMGKVDLSMEAACIVVLSVDREYQKFWQLDLPVVGILQGSKNTAFIW